MECRGTHLTRLKKSGNHDREGWTASSVVIHWSISIPISDPLFTENNIRGRDLCTVWPLISFSRNSSGDENLSHNSDICYYYSNVDLVIFISRRQNMFCTASVQKIFYHHGVLRWTSTVSRLQTWWWSILQIFVSILVNVQRLQVCKDAVDLKFHFVSLRYLCDTLHRGPEAS